MIERTLMPEGFRATETRQSVREQLIAQLEAFEQVADVIRTYPRGCPLSVLCDGLPDAEAEWRRVAVRDSVALGHMTSEPIGGLPWYDVALGLTPAGREFGAALLQLPAHAWWAATAARLIAARDVIPMMTGGAQ